METSIVKVCHYSSFRPTQLYVMATFKGSHLNIYFKYGIMCNNASNLQWVLEQSLRNT